MDMNTSKVRFIGLIAVTLAVIICLTMIICSEPSLVGSDWAESDADHDIDSIVVSNDGFIIDGLEYEILETGNVAVVGCLDTEAMFITIPSHVTLPPSGTDYVVTKIGKNAFKDMTQIVSVSIPVTVTELGKHAFKGCESLKELSISSSVDCHHGTDDFAFKDVELTHLNLINGADYPSTYVKEFWTSWKSSLKELTVGEGIIEFTTSLKEWDALESVTLKDVLTIQEDQFRKCKRLVTVIAPKVTTVNDNAFMDCQNLSTVDLTSIESYTRGIFVHCTNLTTLISERMFINCKRVFMTLDDKTASLVQYLDEKSLIVPIPMGVRSPSGKCYNVTVIGKEAFRECKKIWEVWIHDDIVKIDEHAFHDCKGLRKLTIPIGIDCSYNTDKFAFDGVEPEELVLTSGQYDQSKYMENEFWKPFLSHFVSLFVDEGILKFETTLKGKDQKLVTMYSVTEIQKDQFKNCDELVAIMIPHAKIIEESAFKGCESLCYVMAPSLRVVEKSSFYKCKSLQSFECPNLEIIEKKAFQKCYNLESFLFTNVKEIGSKAFRDTKVKNPAEQTGVLRSGSGDLKVADDAFGESLSYKIMMIIGYVLSIVAVIITIVLFIITIGTHATLGFVGIIIAISLLVIAFALISTAICMES